MFNKLSLITLGVVLSACAGKSHPVMTSFTPRSVVIDYSDNDLHEATYLAQQYCSSSGKDAQYVRTEESGWVTTKKIAFFNCEESMQRHMNQGGSSSSHTPIINNFK